jgi:type VI secretion system protein ImpA
MAAESKVNVTLFQLGSENMPLQNIESLLQPVSADAPCGPDLEYDPAFLELDRISQGKPEQQMGETIVPAEEPDWKEVGNRTLALLAKTKDLRIAMRLTRALLNTESLAGLADGLKVLRGIVETFWDGFYPKLDPEDENDPTFRVNILMGLCDSAAFVDRIRMVPLVSARSFGRFSLRDFAIASGEIPPPAGTEAPKTSAIDGAFTECPVPTLQATAETLRSSLDSLAAIEAFVGDKVGAANGVNFAKLADTLRSAEKILVVRLAKRGVVTEGSAEGASGEDGSATGAGGGQGASGTISGEINSREDVIRVLDKIVSYYERAEPSSPIPLLIKRSKRLVSASFLDIVRDIASDGLSQVENLRGKDENET